MAEKQPTKLPRPEPRVLRGFRDFDPPQQAAKERLLEIARQEAMLRGFLPLQTATIEHAETLLGPEYSTDTLKELFGFRGPDDTDMALRYELTVSLARYVAMQPNLQFPFRRFQYGPVWRYDKPGPGRFREFTQFDLDCVGTGNLLADAEVIATMLAILRLVGIDSGVVHLSSRKILNGLIQWAGIPAERAGDVMRVIDKLPKQGREAVRLELGPGRTDSSGDRISGLRLPDDLIRKLDIFLDLAESKEGDPLAGATELLTDQAVVQEGCDDLRQLISRVHSLGVPAPSMKIDLTIVRGLGYYTGPVFECVLPQLPDFGSVFSGGRYDNLLERFRDERLPAVGVSLGVDRLLAALEALRSTPVGRSSAFVLVTIMDRDRLADYLSLAETLRAAGLTTEIYQGDQAGFGKQLKYADRLGIQFAVIIGSNEWKAETVTVKNLAAGRAAAEGATNREAWLATAGEVQVTIPMPQLIPFLKDARAKFEDGRGV